MHCCIPPPSLTVTLVQAWYERVSRRRYESCRSSKPKLRWKQNNKIWRKTIFNMWMEFLHPAMWHDHDIDFARWLHWIHPAAAPCNVTRSFGITTLNSTTSLQSTCHSAPVSNILSKSDHPQQKKWRHVDVQDGGSQPSWVLGIQ